jgi:PAS domain S-box-containing protein
MQDRPPVTVSIDFRRVFDAVPHLLLVCDLDLRVVEANSASCAILGRRRESLVGREAFSLFPDNPQLPARDGAEAVRTSMEVARETGQTQVMPVQRYDGADPGTGIISERYCRCPVTSRRSRPTEPDSSVLIRMGSDGGPDRTATPSARAPGRGRLQANLSLLMRCAVEWFSQRCSSQCVSDLAALVAGELDGGCSNRQHDEWIVVVHLHGQELRSGHARYRYCGFHGATAPLRVVETGPGPRVSRSGGPWLRPRRDRRRRLATG